VAIASAVNIRTTLDVGKAYKAASLVSPAVIFFPGYSGVLPTIRPPRNTAINAIIRILYRPVPSPPKTASPSSRYIRSTRTLRGR
jgi:hypothetical protein